MREPAPNKAKILDFHHMKCAYPAKMNTKPILLLQEADICDVELLKMRDACHIIGPDETWRCEMWPTQMPFDAFQTTRKISMYAEFTCDCNIVWLIRRLKSKTIRDRFIDYEALFCKRFKKSKRTLTQLTKFTENDVCPQKDINECLASARVCGKNETCHDKEDGYECRCKKGFTREKDICVHLCKSKKNPCRSTSKCEIIQSSSATSHRCVDIDECLSGQYTCGDGEECYNKENGYECRCKQWMKRENGICVSTIDPCKRKPPLCNVTTQRCVNGKNFNIHFCEDIDECDTQQHECDENAKCINTEPGYVCQCKPGYKKYDNGRKCKDIDECISDSDCGIHSQCKNTQGSYECICKKGYQRHRRICEDIDECDEIVCPAQSTCENTPGSYSCECLPGYEWKHHRCLDIDECKTSIHTCNENSICLNEVGGYKCICKEGYEFRQSGRSCVKKGDASGKSSSSLLGIAISVPLCLLVIMLVGFGLYFQRKNKRKKTEEEKMTNEGDTLLQKKKQPDQQTVFMFNPNAQHDTAMLDFSEDEEERDYDEDVW